VKTTAFPGADKVDNRNSKETISCKASLTKTNYVLLVLWQILTRAAFVSTPTGRQRKVTLFC